MKKLLYIVITLFCLSLFAKDIEPQTGTAVFKIKNEYRQQLSKNGQNTGLTSLDAKLQSLQTKAVKPYFTASSGRSNTHDISLIYRVESDFPPQAVVNLLAQDPHVQYAEIVYPDEILAVPNDANYPASEYFAALEAEAAWDIHKGEDGINPVILAVVDTGTRWTHPDLAENIWNNIGEDSNGNGYTIYYNGSAWVMDAGDLNGLDDDSNGYIDDLIGWDFMVSIAGEQSNDPYEASGHGTNVSGIADARTNNTIGVSSLAWNVTLMPVSCGFPGSSSIYRGYEGIVYAAENGADIINCSWGGTGYSQTNQTAIDYAYSLGSIIVAAAGNSNNSIPIYPAAYQNVIATAALQNTGVKSSVSNYGAYVDVGAPNTNVGTTSGAGYALVSTYTSYASPIASSLAALIKSYFPAITQQELINRIKGSCDDVDALNPGKENLLGEGKLNARRALEEVDPQPDNEIRLFLLQNRGATDANNNKAVEAGETFSVNLTLRSYGSTTANGTFILSTTNPAANITSNTHNQLIPADGYLDIDNAFSITVSPTATSQYINFTLSVLADQVIVGPSTFSFSILVHNGGIFIWEGVASARNMSGAFIRTTLQGLGYTCTYGTTFPTSFYSFEAVFLSFGAVDGNIARFNQTYMFTSLREYLEAGGRVYIEGADVVGFDLTYYLPDVDGALDAHEVLWPLLGINGADDGVNNPINALTGVSNTPVAGLSFAASAQTNVDYIDTFTPAETYARAAFNESDYGCVAVAGAGAMQQRTFVFSYALRELTDGVFPHTRANLIERIMEFFEAEEVTLPLELTSFTATYLSTPQLLWSTASETELLGYNIYRSQSGIFATSQKLNPVLIAATGGANGADYRYTDDNEPDAPTQYYWLEAVSYNGVSQVFGYVVLEIPGGEEPSIPPVMETMFSLQAYPNPFGSQVYLKLNIPAKSPVEINVFNLKGQLIKQLGSATYDSGTHFLNWDGYDAWGQNTAAGVYFMVMKTPSQVLRRKIVKL